jgi:hypothetical protein
MSSPCHSAVEATPNLSHILDQRHGSHGKIVLRNQRNSAHGCREGERCIFIVDRLALGTSKSNESRPHSRTILAATHPLTVGHPLLTAWHRTTSAVMAEGVALPEENSHTRKAVVVRFVSVFVLHRVSALRCT